MIPPYLPRLPHAETEKQTLATYGRLHVLPMHENSTLAGAVNSSPETLFWQLSSEQKHSLKNDTSHSYLGWLTDWWSKAWGARWQALLACPAQPCPIPWQAHASDAFPRLSESHSSQPPERFGTEIRNQESRLLLLRMLLLRVQPKFTAA